MHGGHAPALGGERNLAGAWPSPLQLAAGIARALRRFKDRDLCRIAADGAVRRNLGIVIERHGSADGAPGLVARIGRRQLVELHLGRIEPLGPHQVLGQGSGLVAADDGDRAERLDRRQAANQGILSGHALGAHGQRDRDHGRQSFGYGGHGQADRGQEHQQRYLVAEQAGGEDDRADHQDRCGEPTPKVGQTLLQRGHRALVLAHQGGDHAEFGVRARGHRNAASVTTRHIGALVGHRGPLRQCRLGGDHSFGVLDHRQGFTRQRRLVDHQVRRLDQPQVGRHHLAGLEKDDISWHQLVLGDPHGRAVPQGLDPRRAQPLQGLQGALGPVFLNEADDAVEQHDDQDRDRIYSLAD